MKIVTFKFLKNNTTVYWPQSPNKFSIRQKQRIQLFITLSPSCLLRWVMFLLTFHMCISYNKCFWCVSFLSNTLLQDCLKELRKVSTFLELDLSDERLQQVVDRCSLERLKKDVEEGRLRSLMVDKDGKSVVYRKGRCIA